MRGQNEGILLGIFVYCNGNSVLYIKHIGGAE